MHGAELSEGQHQQLLTLEQVVPFLRRHELIAERALVTGDIVVRDLSRRNLGFAVRAGDNASFFVKQPRAGRDHEPVTAEAIVHRWLESLPGASELRPFLPQVRCFDEDAATLVVDFVDGGESLGDLQWRRRRLPSVVGALAGQAVGTLHRVTRAALETAAPIHPSARYLQLHRPAYHVFVESSAATNQLVRLVQASEELAGSLDDLHRQWRPDTLIHADLRLDNFLVSDVQEDGRPRLTIIDWETAGTGDSGWDVGTFFAGNLYGWLLSAPVTHDGSPGAFVELARLSLPAMRPAMRRFWRAYVRARGMPIANRDEFLERAMRYTGARLVQHAFEEAQRMTRLNALAIYLLQLGLNIMQRPVDAAARLLGLPVPLAVLA